MPIIPEIRFASWNSAELADPIGTRHIASGSFAYIKSIGLGCSNALVFHNLRLNAGENEPYASSKVAIVNFSFPNFGDLQASGISTVNNMKLWLPAGSGTVLDLPGAHLQFQASGVWVANPVFPSGAGSTLPDTLPGHYNITRIDGSPHITSFNDQNVSQWIYLRLFLDANFPPGTYGACGSGLLRLRLSYDYY